MPSFAFTSSNHRARKRAGAGSAGFAATGATTGAVPGGTADAEVVARTAAPGEAALSSEKVEIARSLPSS